MGNVSLVLSQTEKTTIGNDKLKMDQNSGGFVLKSMTVTKGNGFWCLSILFQGASARPCASLAWSGLSQASQWTHLDGKSCCSSLKCIY